MIDLLGYGALVLNLVSMAMKNVLRLRIFSLIANVLYLIYGIYLPAPPFILGCSIAIGLHAYHIYLLLTKPTPYEQ